MSEYQYVVFQAIDGPLNDKQLDFAQQQPTRAEVSRWSLSVEYHYSSFRGDVDGLLRRGYDVYLQYTNYGDREIKLRLPHGMPVAKSVWSKYVDGEVGWKKDAKGRGGILSLCPFHETGELEAVWESQQYLDAAVQGRERLLSGDLRALYLLWLCAANDDYNDPAEILYDLREAVGGDEGDKITRRHAAHLSKKHPTLSHLKSSLRKRGLLE